jgi:transcription termination/antitermination protein NusG
MDNGTAPSTDRPANDTEQHGDSPAQESKPEQAQAGNGEAPSRASQPSIGPNIAPPNSEKKWYIVHTYSGHENKAKLTLLERVRNNNLTDYFGDVLVPTESVTENVKGQRRTTTRKFFPGYMFVQMVLDDRTFHLVKNTPKITGFLGGMKPTPVPEREIHGVQTNVAEGKTGKPKARVTFEPGESVRVIDGPFQSFSATVEEVKQDKQKLKVSLSMFGRATSVELDFAQVEKA